MGFLDYFRQPDSLLNLPPESFEEALSGSDIRIIDVRTSGEYRKGHIEGSELHPLGSMPAVIPDLDRDARYLLICATGHRSRAAAAQMIRGGIENVAHLEGGIRAWKKSGRNLVTDPE